MVKNGQRVDEDTFNPAFVSRTAAETSTASKLKLENNQSESGSDINNSQREHNSIASFIGKSVNAAHNLTPTWASDIVGSASQTVKARVEALVSRFNGTTGHNHDGTDGEGQKISQSNTIWDIEKGITAFSGGGQASAIQLADDINEVSTVAADNDSVKLPALVTGKRVRVINNGENILDVFPQSGEVIDSLAADASDQIESGNQKIYIGGASNWESVSAGGGGAGGGLYVLTGTYASPTAVGATGISSLESGARKLAFVEGDSGHIEVDNSTPVPNPDDAGEELTIVGTSDTQTLSFKTQGNIILNGDVVLSKDKTLTLVAVSEELWVETARNF